MADEEKRDHWVEELGEDRIAFLCGHEGSAVYAIHTRDGVLDPKPAFLASRELCGDCLLQELTNHQTHCTECRTPIVEGAPCILYQGDVRCQQKVCNPERSLCTHGTWSGEHFVPSVPEVKVTLVVGYFGDIDLF